MYVVLSPQRAISPCHTYSDFYKMPPSRFKSIALGYQWELMWLWCFGLHWFKALPPVSRMVVNGLRKVRTGCTAVMEGSRISHSG
jgi:hypothetical protein